MGCYNMETEKLEFTVSLTFQKGTLNKMHRFACKTWDYKPTFTDFIRQLCQDSATVHDDYYDCDSFWDNGGVGIETKNISLYF